MDVRVGKLSDQSRTLLTKIPRVEETVFKSLQYSKLFTVISSVDAYNDYVYSSIIKDGLIYESFDYCKSGFVANERNIPMGKVVKLKVGSRVMIRMNLESRYGNEVRRLVNGQVGTVVHFRDSFPVIKFDHTPTNCFDISQFQKYEIQSPVNNTVVFYRIQLPLELAHGITVQVCHLKVLPLISIVVSLMGTLTLPYRVVGM
jgi:hypothetical protein